MSNHAYGYLPAKIDLRDYKLCSANAEVDYPNSFELTDLPNVKDQSDINSCCAHAISSILEYHDKNNHELSTNFVYGIQRKIFNQNKPGMLLAQACQIVTDYGDMVWLDCPGNDEVPKCSDKAEKVFEDENLRNRSYHFRTLSYYLCENEKDIKYALMNYGPVLAGIDWKQDYFVDNEGVIYFDSKSNGMGHAVMIYGWDGRGWKIQNSWGRGFGKNGRFILPYSYGILEARALIDYENEDDLTLVKPKRNWFLNICYKIGNFLMNLK